jgi:hypothetical protein
VTSASKHLLFQTDFDCEYEVTNYNNIQIIVILRNDIKYTNIKILRQTFPVIDLIRFHRKNILYESATKQNYPLWIRCHVNEHASLSDV